MTDQAFLTTAAGVKIPWIIYGTAWKKKRTLDLVVKAVQTGFRGIDTACQPKHYNESLVGAALQKNGGSRQLGISNCYVTEVLAQLYMDANVKPAVVQNRFYQQTGYDKDLRNWCSNHGVTYQSFWL